MTNHTKQKKTRYLVTGTATVSVSVYVYADSREEAIEKADSGETDVSPQYDTDGERDYTYAEEAPTR